MIHELKTLSSYFEAQLNGSKPFEIRKNDRDYKVGDLLALNEVSPDANKYTGNSLLCEVTYVLDLKDWVEDSKGFVVLGTRKLWVKFKDSDRELIFGKGRDINNLTNRIKDLAKLAEKASEEVCQAFSEAAKRFGENPTKPFGVCYMEAVEKAKGNSTVLTPGPCLPQTEGGEDNDN